MNGVSLRITTKYNSWVNDIATTHGKYSISNTHFKGNEYNLSYNPSREKKSNVAKEELTSATNSQHMIIARHQTSMRIKLSKNDITRD